jgi:hypothetical protein
LAHKAADISVLFVAAFKQADNNFLHLSFDSVGIWLYFSIEM